MQHLQHQPGEPDEQQIAKLAAKIRESWTEEEHYRRSGVKNGRPPRWFAPMVKSPVALTGQREE